MAKIEESYEAVCDFFARDQFLDSCSRELYVHLKPKSFKNLEEMAKEADLFAEARGGVYTSVNKVQRDNKGGSQHKSDGKPSRKPEIKCSICGKGHLNIKCYKNPDRKQAYSAEVDVRASGYGGSKGSNSVPKEEAQGMQSKNDNMPSKGNSSSRGRGNFRGRGRGYDNRNYQLRFCRTEISRQSDEIKSIYQNKSESPFIADKGDEEGVCYFLRSRLPAAQGTVNGKKVIALRDTGCTGCVVRRSLVSSDQLLGKESDVTLIDESTQRYPLAMVEIDCPFFTGTTEALCMDDTLYDLVIGNIDGSKLPDMSHFSAAAVTRAQANREKAYRKLNDTDQIISKDKEAFKQAQDSDPKLNGIRQRVESGSVTISRGLNRGETKFVLKKDLMCRQFTKGNKLTLQFVIPESFREKVLRLAHETLMSGHLGIKKTMDRVLTEFF